MPEIGEIQKGRDIGYRSDAKFLWIACADCGKERWVLRYAPSKYCSKCSQYRERSTRWQGGRNLNGNRYYTISLKPDDFFYHMSDHKGCVSEHRLVMAKHLGRCLQSWEIVHHKNHIRTDNRIENLQLMSNDKHQQITILETRISILEKRITVLEAENELLKKQAFYRPIGAK